MARSDTTRGRRPGDMGQLHPGRLAADGGAGCFSNELSLVWLSSPNQTGRQDDQTPVLPRPSGFITAARPDLTGQRAMRPARLRMLIAARVEPGSYPSRDDADAFHANQHGDDAWKKPRRKQREKVAERSECLA